MPKPLPPTGPRRTTSRRPNQLLRMLMAFEDALARSEPGALVPGALNFLKDRLAPAHVSVALLDGGGERLRLHLIEKSGGLATDHVRFPEKGDILTQAIRDRKTACCADTVSAPGRARSIAGRLTGGVRSLTAVPLRTRDDVLGTLNFGTLRPRALTEPLRIFLEAAAGRLASALHGAAAQAEAAAECLRLQRECALQRSALAEAKENLEHQVAERTADIRKLQERLRAENLLLREELAGSRAYGEIVGESPPLRAVIARIGLVAPTEASVLIMGESGTGKELVAREIHRHSRRSERALITVNCATIPKELYESEFFGHVKGAFTGAINDRIGRFEAADGGTLFLDEVGEIPLDLQGKLLRILQDGEFERVGEGRTRRVDVRIIAATNKDLAAEIRKGRFREDLYYRLNVFPIEIAPLRRRSRDIAPLAAHFLEKLSRRMSRPAPRLTEANLADLMRHDWPGNVRELQNVIERALILSPSGRLHFDVPAAAAPGAAPPEASPEPGTVLGEAEIKRLQRQNMRAALARCGWRIYGSGGAAQLLGIKPTTLIERMRAAGIRRPGRIGGGHPGGESF